MSTVRATSRVQEIRNRTDAIQQKNAEKAAAAAAQKAAQPKTTATSRVQEIRNRTDAIQQKNAEKTQGTANAGQSSAGAVKSTAKASNTDTVSISTRSNSSSYVGQYKDMSDESLDKTINNLKNTIKNSKSGTATYYAQKALEGYQAEKERRWNLYQSDSRYQCLLKRVDSWNGIDQYKKDFVLSVFPKAIEYERKTGIPAEIIFGQMCVESNYGAATIVDKYNGKNANNYFGYKGKGPAGSVISDTTEYINSKRVKIEAEFKAYNSIDESLDDYTSLLSRKYSKFISSGSPEDWASALDNGGYATAPNYGETILDVARTWRVC